MGFNHDAAGFETAGEFARYLSSSEANQIEAFARFVEKRHLLDELQRYDWVGFARQYNGVQYRANRYDERLARAYVAAAQDMDVPIPEAARRWEGGICDPNAPPSDEDILLPLTSEVVRRGTTSPALLLAWLLACVAGMLVGAMT
jgi:hypothetical protein